MLSLDDRLYIVLMFFIFNAFKISLLRDYCETTSFEFIWLPTNPFKLILFDTYVKQMYVTQSTNI